MGYGRVIMGLFVGHTKKGSEQAAQASACMFFADSRSVLLFWHPL